MQLFRTDRALAPSLELIRPSIRLVRENIWPVFYLSFLPGLVAVVGMVLASDITEGRQTAASLDGRAALGLVLVVVGSLWSLVTYPGLLLLQTKAVAGEHPTATDCFKQGLPRLLPFIFMSIMAVSLMILGLLALIIPGLILVRGFCLAPYYVIDQKLSPVEALRKSYADSKPNAGYIWGVIGVGLLFGIVSSALGYIPVIGYVVGMVVGLVYLFAPAFRYGEITKNQVVRLDV